MSFNYNAFRPDPNIPMPFYYQIESYLRENIDNGNIAEGECLPPETELMEIYGVSRSTIRQAISELVKYDVLYRHKGKGTFVKPPKIEGQSFQVLTSFNDEIRRKGRVPSTRVLEISVIDAPDRVCNEIGLRAGAKVIYMQRLRFVDGDPILYFETFLPYEKYKGLENEDLEHSSLYDILEQKYSTRVNRVMRRVEVSNVSKNEAQLLGIKRGDAIFLVRFTGYCADEPVEYSVTRYRGDKNEFVIELRR